MMDSQTIDEWAKKDLWSESEFQALCCGLEPNAARPNTKELNDAIEAIRRAILAGALPCICPLDATTGDKLYGHARFFRPADAINWAASRFPEFPTFPATQQKCLTSGGASWPWGNYETELLRKLAAAADKFWKNYDRSDNTTAPTNQEVTKWLKGRQVSGRVAEIMAQILRPDGLPTGPRK